MTCHRRTNPYRPRLLVQVGKHVTMEDHGNTVFCCAFSHDIVEGLDGKAVDLATASYDGTTRVWDLAKCAGNHSKKCRRILKGNPGGVWCCAYTHDSRFLVTGCSKGSICVYSAPQRYDLVGRQDSSHGPNAVFACSTGAQVRVCMSVCMCPPAHSCWCRHA
jgi:WD40 repeat protein